MSYHFTNVKSGDFDEVVEEVTEALKTEGFGVLTEIDVKQTLKKKLDIDFPRYKILGACNPNFAHQALQIENKIGTMLPCNVIVQENGDGSIEISAVNPVESMSSVENPELAKIAGEVKNRLKKIIDAL